MGFLVEFEEMLYFQGLDGIYGEIVVIFDGMKSGEMLDFPMFCRSHYRTRKLGFRRGNIRYAVPGNRTIVLKCKPSPYLHFSTLKR